MGRTIYGSKGTLRYGDQKVIVEPQALQRGRGAAPPTREYEVDPYDIWQTHMEDFLDCMRTREKPNLNGDLGYRIMVPIKLGVDSYREGRVGFFDAERQQVAYSGPPRDGYEGEPKNFNEFKRFPGDR
jgi:hypothetical protein